MFKYILVSATGATPMHRSLPRHLPLRAYRRPTSRSCTYGLTRK